MTLAARSGRHHAAREAACAALLARLRSEGVEQVRVAWADVHGTLRGKTLVMDADGAVLSSALDEGLGLVSTLLLKDTSDRTAFAVFEHGGLKGLTGFASANNVLLLPDPASFVVLPWASGTGWLRAQPLWPDGGPVLADPRLVLQRALARLADAGYGLRCGLEVEFHIHRITDARLAAE
ncbi:MAG: glutamine synthetase, partial [Burkholderiaceae bacterium]|nr:glutamine synthetase [Burkholderiaceae bacterium]